MWFLNNENRGKDSSRIARERGREIEQRRKRKEKLRVVEAKGGGEEVRWVGGVGGWVVIMKTGA